MNFFLVAINAKFIHSNPAVYLLKQYALDNLPAKVNKQVQIEIGEYTINQSSQEVLADIFMQKADVVCFSCYIWNFDKVLGLISDLKKVAPHIKICLGGPEVSFHQADLLAKHQEIDSIITGEGEAAFVTMIEATIAGKEQTLFPEQLVAMDELPFIYRDVALYQHRLVYYESSRGCPFSCSYCLSCTSKQVRFRSTDLVKQELQCFLAQKIPQVKFVDRTFNCNHQHAYEIWSYIIEHDNGVTNFHFEIAADLLNDKELQLLSTARLGLIQFEIGIQSTNQDTLKEISRAMNYQRVKQNVETLLAQRRIHLHLDLIVGLPYEDSTSFMTSFNQVYQLTPQQLQMGFLKVLKGSTMERKVDSYELQYQSHPPYEILANRWLTYEAILRLKQVEEMLEVYYNSGQFVHTMIFLVDFFSSPFALYQALANYYQQGQLSGLSHSRLQRYEILERFFMSIANKKSLDKIIEDEKKSRADVSDNEEKLNSGKFRELLTYDYYLRENIKSRPTFAGLPTITKEEAKKFYDNEAKAFSYLRGYEGYDKRQLRKMTHLERINGEILLFDYRNRDLWNHQATVHVVTID